MVYLSYLDFEVILGLDLAIWEWYERGYLGHCNVVMDFVDGLLFRDDN